MKKKGRSKLKEWIISIVILSSLLIGITITLYQLGIIERELSTVIIPFELFKKRDYQNITALEIVPSPLLPMANYRDLVEPLSKQLDLKNTEKPSIKDVPLTQSGQIQLQELINHFYQNNAYIGQISISGIVETNQGSKPILTFSILNDTPTVSNHHYLLEIDSSNDRILINSFTYYKSSQDTFWYRSLPLDFNLNNLNKYKQKVFNFFKQDVDDLIPKQINAYKHNTVISHVEVIFSKSEFLITLSVGLPNEVKHITYSVPIDNENDLTLLEIV